MFIEGKDTNGLSDAELTSLRGHAIGFVFQYHHLITRIHRRRKCRNAHAGGSRLAGRPDAADRSRPTRQSGSFQMAKQSGPPACPVGNNSVSPFARSLAMNPALVLADEPTGNLDTKSADDVFALMRNVNRSQGTTFLIITHNLELASRTDRIIEIVDGKLVARAQ